MLRRGDCVLREGEETLADDSLERLSKVNADIAAEDKKCEEIISSKPAPGGNKKAIFSWAFSV